MNKEELQQLERESHLNKVPLLTNILIVQTGRKHESGYKVMEVYGINNETGYKKKLDDYCDVVQFGEFFDGGLIDSVRMDIPESGVIHLFTFGRTLFKVEHRMSDFVFTLVERKNENE